MLSEGLRRAFLPDAPFKVAALQAGLADPRWERTVLWGLEAPCCFQVPLGEETQLFLPGILPLPSGSVPGRGAREPTAPGPQGSPLLPVQENLSNLHEESC